MAGYPTPLSLAGAAIYLVVSVLCVMAWARSRRPFTGARAGRFGWPAIAALFTVFALSRIFVIEDRFDDFLRGLARENGVYDGRAQWQGPLTVLAIVAIAMLCVLLARVWRSARRDPARQTLVMAQFAAVAMIGLFVVRLISFHPIDSLLYGGLRLNWWLDIGLSFVVGAAAWFARKTPAD